MMRAVWHNDDVYSIPTMEDGDGGPGRLKSGFFTLDLRRSCQINHTAAAAAIYISVIAAEIRCRMG